MDRPDCECFRKEPQQADNAVMMIGRGMVEGFLVNMKLLSICPKALEHSLVTSFVYMASVITDGDVTVRRDQLHDFFDRLPGLLKDRMTELERIRAERDAAKATKQ